MLLKSEQSSLLITQLLLILLVPSHHCQFLVSDDGGDDNVCGAESQCVIISKCPAVLKLVFKVKSGDASARRQLLQLQCGFENSLPRVCCQSSSGPRTPPPVRTFDPTTEKTDPTPFTTSTSTTTTTTTSTTTTTTTTTTTEESLSTTTSSSSPDYSSINAADCGTRTSLQFRITLGEDAGRGQFPWMAALMYRNPRGQKVNLCGGTLVSHQHVLTAAHCDDERFGFIMSSVILGHVDLSTRVTLPGVEVTIDKIISHPGYAQDPVAVNDIAMVKLTAPVLFTDMIRPICVFQAEDLGRDLDGEFSELLVAGWGRTERARSSPLLQFTELHQVNNDECDQDYGVTGIRIRETQVCARGENETDSCSGDSGGPLMRHVVGDRWYLAGVVSFGTNECNSVLPGVYTNIPSYYDWILETLKL